MWRRLGMGAGLIVGVAACTPATRLDTGIPLRDMTVLPRSEILLANTNDAYDAIAQLRPQYFNRHGETSILLRSQTFLNVYLDDQRLGGVESLRGFPVSMIQTVRYFNAAEATYRWGTNNTGGAIQIVTHPLR